MWWTVVSSLMNSHSNSRGILRESGVIVSLITIERIFNGRNSSASVQLSPHPLVILRCGFLGAFGALLIAVTFLLLEVHQCSMQSCFAAPYLHCNPLMRLSYLQKTNLCPIFQHSLGRVFANTASRPNGSNLGDEK